MTTLGVWKVTNEGPNRLVAGDVGLEMSLEEWIESDPSLVENGLTVVGRQISMEVGVLDLLAVDVQGRLAVIEIKRDRLTRDTVAQALDYAAVISAMPLEELRERVSHYVRQKAGTVSGVDLLPLRDEGEPGPGDVRVIIVGTTKDPSLERVAAYLRGFEVPLTVVTYYVFQVDESTQLLVRSLTEVEPPTTPPVHSRLSYLLARAAANGVGGPVSSIHEAAMRLQLNARPFKHCIMYTPPANRRRTLFTVPVHAVGARLWTYIATSAFPEFFPVTAAEVGEQIGEEGWRLMDAEDAKRFVNGLVELLSGSNREEMG